MLVQKCSCLKMSEAFYRWDYKRLEITLKGYVESELLQRFDYSSKLGDFNDYLLFEKVYSIDENAEQTKLILRKNIDISEVNYVD